MREIADKISRTYVSLCQRCVDRNGGEDEGEGEGEREWERVRDFSDCKTERD